ncbi:MAG: SpoIID/LytB domain-containing protein, partial [Chloroflexota bacterium]
MLHRRLLAALTAASLLLAGLPGTPVAAASCSGWSSETAPPTTIRVFRTASGAVETVDFRTYTANVLSREWISSWTTESIRAGALVVKNYAWYQVLHWRGYTTPAGACFDVFDSTRDQHYDPSRPTYGPMVAAVDATWTTLALQNGRIFAAYYNAGGMSEACGANVNGWQMFQWGSQACGLAGLSAAQIMATYYAGVQVSAAPPPAPPPATPGPTPPPAPSPTPVPAPDGSSVLAPSATPPPPPPTPVPPPLE